MSAVRFSAYTQRKHRVELTVDAYSIADAVRILGCDPTLRNVRLLPDALTCLEIDVTLRDGAVTEISTNRDVPNGITLRVRDYDVEEPDAATDSDGDPYIETIYSTMADGSVKPLRIS